MTTGIPAKPSRRHSASTGHVALLGLMALTLACSEAPAPQVEKPSSGSPPTSATGPPGPTASGSAVAETTPVQPEPAPAQSAAPVPQPAPPPPPPEPVMEWREAKPKSRAETETDEDGGKTHVYTNVDLSRFAKPEDEKVGSEVAATRQAQDAFDKESLKKVQDAPATEAWRARTKAEAEERVRSAEAKLEALRRLALSDANPLLPQPRLASEEEKKREGLSREQRYKMTQQEIQQAEQEVADAKANLAQVLKNLAPPR